MSKIVKKSNRNPKSQFKTAIVNQLTDLLSVQKEKLWDLIQIPKSQTHGQFTLPIPRLLKLYPQQDKEEACNKIVRSVRHPFFFLVVVPSHTANLYTCAQV